MEVEFVIQVANIATELESVAQLCRETTVGYSEVSLCVNLLEKLCSGF